MSRIADSRRMSRLRAVAVVLALTLVAALFGPAALAAPGDPADRIEAVLAGLADDGEEAKAAKHLEKALEDEHWSDPATLTKKGEKVFDELGKAAKDLDKAGLWDEITELMDIAEALFADYEDAHPLTGKDAEKVDKELTKASEEMADGKVDKYIEKIGKAWKHAYKAVEKAEKEAAKALPPGTGHGGGGDYAEYTVVFFNPATGQFLQVSGTNAGGTPGFTGQGNEGYIFSAYFVPTDSEHGAALTDPAGRQGMQLHVSCSDAFSDGTGDKSDPTDTSQWLVNTISITRWKGGEIHKQCQLPGLDLPVPDIPIVE